MNFNYIRIENLYQHSLNETYLINMRKQEINKKYLDFANFIEILIKTKIEFFSEGFVNRDIKSLSDLIEFIVKMFFEVYFELDFSKRENLIELISKFCIKLKIIEIINLILAYLQFINEIKNAIRFDYLKDCVFDHEDDIQVSCEDVTYHEDENLINYNLSFKLKLFNDDEEKNNYLKSVIDKVLKFNEDSNFYTHKRVKQLNIETKHYLNNNLIEINKKNKYLKLNEIKIKNVLSKMQSGNTKDSNLLVNLHEPLKFLERDIANHIKYTKRNTSNMKKAFGDFNFIVLRILNSQLNQKFENLIKDIIPFGSVTQFSHNIKSDLEITILTIENYCDLNNLDVIKEIQAGLKQIPDLYNKIELRNTKRTKLLNFYDVKNKVKIELMLNNYLGIINSHLIRSYCLIDSRCVILINIIKDWSKIKKINGNFDGYLSSYCYSMMVIYFLQNLKIPILPVLQTNNYKVYSENDIFVKNSDSQVLHFYLNFDDEFFEDLKRNQSGDENYFYIKNNWTISELLLEFFIFYYYLFDENEYCIDISNRYSVYRYNQIKYLNYYNNKQFVYCFIDPFDYSYNPGCYMTKNSYQEERFKNEMQIAIKNILDSKSIF